MIESIKKFKRSNNPEFKYTILIPSWNLLEHLQLCIKSIRKNSHFNHQIIVIVNEGIDGTLGWIVDQEYIDYVYSPQNIGICYALNACRSLITTEYVVYANDDMYFLPEWDKVFSDEIQKIGHKRFMLSATMIEPSGDNPCVVVSDFGTNTVNFKEDELLKNYKSLFRNDWSGSTWPPNIMHIDCWDLVGGMSIEFSPGMASDQDLSRKLWEIGVRIFTGKGNSLVYHFGCKSTKRIKKNEGHKTYTLKWGSSARTFMTKYLHRGENALSELPERELDCIEKINQFIKRLKSCF